jgi:hypothetical protein
MYLIKAKNNGEMSFAEWVEATSAWTQQVVAESEAKVAGSHIGPAPHNTTS